MTIRKMIQAADEFPVLATVAFSLPPFGAWLCRFLHPKGHAPQPPWKYIYLLLLFGASFPGILVPVYAAYVSFFTQEMLPDVRLFCFLLPTCSMILTLMVVHAQVGIPALFRRPPVSQDQPARSQGASQ